MRAVRLARAVADPEEVRRAGVAVAGGGIHARQRLLVGQQQRLVAGVELRLAHLRQVGHAAGLHEAERLVDAVREVGVARGERAARHEAEVPAVHLVQVGIAAGGEGAQQVQRRRRLHVGELHPRRVGHARLAGEVRAVDDVAAVGGQGRAVAGLGVGGARLGELPRHAAELHHRQAAAEGQHHRHLQQHAEGVADDVGGEVGEALGAVAALEDEGLALAGRGQRRLQPPRLAGEDQRRPGREPPLRRRQSVRVRVVGHLPDRHVPPASRVPRAHRHAPQSSNRPGSLARKAVPWWKCKSAAARHSAAARRPASRVRVRR